jgi:hypothetical protein
MDTWAQSRFINDDGIRGLATGLQQQADALREILRPLNAIATYSGPILEWLGKLHISSPALGFLNSIASIIDQLITNFLNTGGYFIVHHNIREALRVMGVYNLVGAPANADIPPVPSPTTTVPGARDELTRDDQEEGQGTISFSETLEGVAFSQISGFEKWVADIINAFDDVSDTSRPVVGPLGEVGGVIFLCGAETFVDLEPFAKAFMDVFELQEFREIWAALANLPSVDLEQGCRFGEGMIRHTVQENAFGYGERPNFISQRIKDILPPLGRIVTDFSSLVDLLHSVDGISSLGRDLVRAIENRIRAINRAFQQIANMLDRLAYLAANTPAVYSLALNLQAGGVAGLQQRIREAEGRPNFGSGSMLLGGGIFFTTPIAYDIIKNILFPDGSTPGTNPLIQFNPFAGFTCLDFPDFVIPSSQWPTYLAVPTHEQIVIDSASDGMSNTQMSIEGTSRGTTSQGGEFEDKPDSRRESSSGTAERFSREGALTTDEEDSLGAQVGGLTLKRDSWGSYTAELVRTVYGRDRRGGSSVICARSNKGLYVAHAAHDTPRMETIPVGDYPSGVLIEGERTNYYRDSDRFSAATGYYQLTKTVVENASPTADLLRHPAEAGPAVLIRAPQRPQSILERDLRCTPDHAGCGLTNIIRLDGSLLDLTTVNAGDYVIGTQVVNVLDAQYPMMFYSHIDSVDLARQMLIISPAVFTQPAAQQLLISGMAIIEDGALPYLYIAGLVIGANLEINTFSVYARSNQWDTAHRGLNLRHFGDARGPTYSNQSDLQPTVLRTLLPRTPPLFEFNDGILLAQAGSPTPVVGDLVELLVDTGTSTKCWSYFVSQAVEATDLTLVLRPATANDELYKGYDIIDARVISQEGTYQGFTRVVCEIPTRHRERLAFVPAVADPNSYLTLSCSHATSPEAWIVDLAGNIPIPYDASLSGDSYRFGPDGAVLLGRKCIEVSPGLKTHYPARVFEIEYSRENLSTTAHIMPVLYVPSTGIDWVNPPAGEAYIWRAQFEHGPLSSSIPTPANTSRTRQLDRVEANLAKWSAPNRAGARLRATAYPSFRSRLLSTVGLLPLFYATDQFVVGFTAVGSNAAIQLVAGPVTVLSSPFSYVGDDCLDLIVAFGYGDTKVHFELLINGLSVLNEDVVCSALPAVDELIAVGAKMYVGSDGSDRAFFGRVSNLTVEDYQA